MNGKIRLFKLAILFIMCGCNENTSPYDFPQNHIDYNGAEWDLTTQSNIIPSDNGNTDTAKITFLSTLTNGLNAPSRSITIYWGEWVFLRADSVNQTAFFSTGQMLPANGNTQGIRFYLNDGASNYYSWTGDPGDGWVDVVSLQYVSSLNAMQYTLVCDVPLYPYAGGLPTGTFKAKLTGYFQLFM